MQLRLQVLSKIRMDRTIYRKGSIPVTDKGERAMLLAELTKVMDARRLIIRPALPLKTVPGTYNREFYAVMIKEEPSLSEYPTGWAFSGPKTGVINTNFEERRKLGEIIVSPYSASSGFGTYEYDYVEQSAAGGTSYSPSFHTLKDVNAFPAAPGYPDAVMINGNRYHGQFTSIYTQIILSPSKHPVELGFDFNEIVKAIGTIEKKVDDPLVLSTLSEANSGTLDILTSLAELPDTFRSLMDVMQSIVKIMRDVKKKEFNLTARHEYAKKNIQLRRKSLDSEIAQILEKISVLEKRGRIVTDRDEQRQLRRELQTLRRRRKRLVYKNKSLLRELFDLSTELADAVANLWMNYRYNIETNRMMIEDIIDSFDQYKREFARWRDGVTVSVTLPPISGFVFEGEATVKHRVFIKRSFKAENVLGSLNQILRANFTVTLWELIKRSFVVDWFFTIGDAISALCHNDNYHLQEGSCYSWTVEVDGKYVHPDGGACSVKFKDYKRIVINPRSSIGLYFVPDWNPLRQLDTMAMLWPKVRDLTRNLVSEVNNLSKKGK